MAGFETEYYEQAEFWEQDLMSLAPERERIEKTISIIPQDVHTLLDVGCGNGAFLNALPDRYKAVGLDSSKEALKHVRAETVLGDMANLPFEDASFDVVACLEVLEHLPFNVFEKALEEIQRVSRKYIIVSVPNGEDLDYHLVICPQCRCWYNPYRHLREFDHETLENLFAGFTLSRLEEIGPLEQKPRYNKCLVAAYRLFKDSPPPKTAICPQCGLPGIQAETLRDISDIKPRASILWQIKTIYTVLKLSKPLARMLWRPRSNKRWLLALYTINNLKGYDKKA